MPTTLDPPRSPRFVVTAVGALVTVIGRCHPSTEPAVSPVKRSRTPSSRGLGENFLHSVKAPGSAGLPPRIDTLTEGTPSAAVLSLSSTGLPACPPRARSGERQRPLAGTSGQPPTSSPCSGKPHVTDLSRQRHSQGGDRGSNPVRGASRTSRSEAPAEQPGPSSFSGVPSAVPSIGIAAFLGGAMASVRQPPSGRC
jgi:hypothetical protein